MTDLATNYMGLKLRNPIIVSSSDLTKDVSDLKKCADAGAGAVVLKSIFEEQFLVREEAVGTDYAVYPEALDYMRSGGLMEYAAPEVCRTLEEAKKSVDIPLIASINCKSFKLWPRYARQFEEAGADGLELNIYFLPIQLNESGPQFEEDHLSILREVKKSVSIPVSVKLTHQITSIPHLAKRLAEAGCDGLVLFNWFLEPDILVSQIKTRNIKGRGNIHQVQRWTALLADRIDCDIAGSGGVKSTDDLIKVILAGASAVQICSVFYQKGLMEIQSLLSGLESWMEGHKFASIEDMRGELSFKKQELTFKDLGEAEAFFRAQYLKAYSQ